ncbi:adenosylcobinamide amidohydrolase [Halorubrum sp. DTA98]|uniref:adenosylcobinamide amidohydrolase n=1 Tax=Halorubrum sp. DTA98 TaxID=3402163 RepID=UPI003AAC5225
MTLRADVSDGVCRCRLPGGRFLSTGFDGGVHVADAAYNVTVPEGWGDAGVRDLRSYVDDRLAGVGFTPGSGPALLTGVDQAHARIARNGEVSVVATAGVSNPAALPIGAAERDADRARSHEGTDRNRPIGTVNLVVGTDRDLAPGALANLVAVVAEAKAATLLSATGYPGTTSDAVVVASDPDGGSTEFSGSATPVGSATRACVRDALLASLSSRYDGLDDATGRVTGDGVPESVSDAEHGVVTDREATVSRIASIDRPDGPDR